MKKILITGSSSRFAQSLKKVLFGKNIFYTSSEELDIVNIDSVEENVKKIKPNIFIHLAGLSRPMDIHEKDINNSIDLNIIGTANIVKICKEKKIKIIFYGFYG